LGGLTTFEQRAPGRWRLAPVVGVRTETPRIKTFRFTLPMWMPHLPGQHYLVRLTAPDGYRAQRSYSVASSPLDEPDIELTIDRLQDGEISPYFHDVVVEGDQIELRGPFASYFVWRGEPALLVGGGSGVVPLMAMLRHRRLTAPEVPMKLVYSVRAEQDLIYAAELGEETTITYTREPPDGWSGHTGRLDAELLRASGMTDALVFICGSTAFVGAAEEAALEAGFDPGRIRTERFGPTS
jgi:ferredoxin-NADP reductase